MLPPDMDAMIRQMLEAECVIFDGSLIEEVRLGRLTPTPLLKSIGVDHPDALAKRDEQLLQEAQKYRPRIHALLLAMGMKEGEEVMEIEESVLHFACICLLKDVHDEIFVAGLSLVSFIQVRSLRSPEAIVAYVARLIVEHFDDATEKEGWYREKLCGYVRTWHTRFPQAT
jgi:hypothetical protein